MKFISFIFMGSLVIGCGSGDGSDLSSTETYIDSEIVGIWGYEYSHRLCGKVTRFKQNGDVILADLCLQENGIIFAHTLYGNYQIADDSLTINWKTSSCPFIPYKKLEYGYSVDSDYLDIYSEVGITNYIRLPEGNNDSDQPIIYFGCFNDDGFTQNRRFNPNTDPKFKLNGQFLSDAPL